MKAMGFKDRGSSKFSFKTYDDDSQSDEDQEFQGVDLDELEKHGLPIKRKVRPRSKFYTGPYTFKDNFAGIGYILAPNELCKQGSNTYRIIELLRDGEVKGGEDEKKSKNRIKMSEFNYSGLDEEDDDDLQMTKVYDEVTGQARNT